MKFTMRIGQLLIGLTLANCWACGGDPVRQEASAAAAQPVPRERTAGEDWASFLGPRGDGTSAETGVDAGRWDPIPPVVWTLPLGVSYGAPAIVGNRLLQFDRFGNSERLTCFEAETARELWRWEMKVQYDDMFGYNNGPRCSPIVDGDRVYTYGVTGQLTCLDLASGQSQWTKNLNEDYGVVSNFFGVASNPCIYGDLLFVMVGGSTPETRQLPTERLALVQPNGSAVVALDKATGQERYRLGQDLASYASLFVQALDGKPTGLAFVRNSLIGWEPETGKQLFRFPWRADMLESVNAAMPVVSSSQVLISEAYEVGSALLDVSQSSPQVVWQDGGPRSACRFRAHWSTPVLIDGYLYGCSGRNGPDTDFRCVRFSDGEVMWTDRDRDRQRSSVLAVDGFLIILGEYGRLELVKPRPDKLDVVASAELSELTGVNGAPLLDYPCWAAPVLSHGLLYLRGNSQLVCLDLIPQS
jgi:hypothetical protein